MSFFNGNSRKISDCRWCSILKMLFSVSKLRELWSLWEKLHFNKMYATRYFNAFTCGIWLLQLLRCRNIFTQTNVLKTFHVCAWLWGKILLTLFDDHILSSGNWKKMFELLVGACEKKLFLDPELKRI